MDTWFVISLTVGATGLLVACLIGLRYDRMHKRREVLLPSVADQDRHRASARYFIDVQDSANG